jgi:signal peptide peptidase SppA
MKLSDIANGPWAITPEMLIEIQGIYATHLRGDKIDISKVEAALGRPLANSQQGSTVQDGVAVISVQGVIAKKMNLLSEISGGASSQMVANDFNTAVNDPNIKGIILCIDSPGGTVDGTSELVDAIFQSRGKKPVCAFSDGMIASAAYWIASAADAIYISGDTNPIGSIGVVSAHRDYSKQEEKQGIKTTEITAGAYKRVASQYEPLSADGKAEIQGKVDYLYSIFVDSVARNRGVSTETVLSDMADGRVFLGAQAISNGLVDGVSTMPNIIADMQDNTKREQIMKHKKMAGVPQKKENKKMTKAEILEQFPEAAAEIAADAVAGKQSCGKTCDSCGKKTGAESAVCLISATMGAEVGDKFKALVESGITAEQATALNIKIETSAVANDEASRAAILAALQAAAPTGVQTGKQADETVTDRAAAVAAIVAGGSR